MELPIRHLCIELSIRHLCVELSIRHLCIQLPIRHLCIDACLRRLITVWIMTIQCQQVTTWPENAQEMPIALSVFIHLYISITLKWPSCHSVGITTQYSCGCSEWDSICSRDSVCSTFPVYCWYVWTVQCTTWMWAHIFFHRNCLKRVHTYGYNHYNYNNIILTTCMLHPSICYVY